MELEKHEQEHLNRIYSRIGECIVLLKKNGDFPLKEACEIALYGNGGRLTVKGGTGSGEVNSRFFVNCEEGLEDRGFTILTKDWLDRYDGIRKEWKAAFVKEIKKQARQHHTMPIMEGMGKVMPEGEYQLPIEENCETAVYVLSRISGEGNDRKAEKGDFLLTETEKKDLYILTRKYKKFLLVLNTGGPVDLSEVSFVENILVLSQLGVETGHVLADFLLGRLYPSGKLATTWDAYENYCHEGDFAQWNDTRYKEGIYVGYRYFDSIGRKALYPFGHGLGFADFTYEVKDLKIEGTTVSIDVTLHNDSEEYKGMEVLQVYASKPETKLDHAYQDLVAFQRSEEVMPKQRKEVKITFDLKELSSYDEERAVYFLEQGDYILRLGTSSVETRPIAVLELKEEAILKKVRNCLGKTDFKDLVIKKEKEAIDPSVPRIVIDPGIFATEETVYDMEDPICEELNGCSDEELFYLNIGAFDPKGGAMSAIGEAASTVAGAAGESSKAALEKGLKNIVMADGPAGLRLAQHYYRDEKGAHATGASLPESMLELLPAIARIMIKLSVKKPKKEKLLEQWCTAMPIGTAIAQSFDPDYACELGDIVGTEMEIYNVDLWLAPALNIHRNVLCGRNFEYFSEDPLVSGIMAAAITRGVQAHAGKGTTVKHYAANNQETNRYANSSMVSERAMREIYLKGFEYCIKESKPYAVMSSYNLINGTHTSEHKGLCIDILRREWGYEGILMTDWVVSAGMTAKGNIYKDPDPAKVAAAGHSLFMPGNKKDYENMSKGFKAGVVDRKQLLVNASRMYRLFGKKK
jgi:beta-glucosidase